VQVSNVADHVTVMVSKAWPLFIRSFTANLNVAENN